MSKATIKLFFAVASIAVLGQSCAKDMTTQDFDAELAAENTAKMQVHAATYSGALKDSNGNTVAPISIVVKVQTVNPGANNNASQNVGFDGTMSINVQGEPELRLGYNNAYFDFSDTGNYHFNPQVTMEDGQTTDTVEVVGQFPDSNTMNGELYAGKYPDSQYTLSFSLTRNGAVPAPAALSSTQRDGIVLIQGGTGELYSGTASYSDGSTSPMSMQILANLTQEEAFYAFVSPVNVVDVIITPDSSVSGMEGSDFKNVQLDTIRGRFSGKASNSSGNEDLSLNCTQPQGSDNWNCVTDFYTVTFSPATGTSAISK